MKQIRLLLLLSLIIGVLNTAKGTPVFKIEGKRIFDCGDVVTGDVIHHEFIITNSGDENLLIYGVYKSCNCSTAEISDRVIAPGNSTRLNLTVDTRSKVGYSKISVSVRCNSEQQDHILIMSMNCIPKVEYEKKNGPAKLAIKAMSRDFRKHYSRNYSSKIRYTYTIEANGRFREFVGYEGLLFSLRFTQRSRKAGRITDSNRGCWFPVSGMRSLPWDANKDEILETRTIVGGSGSESGARVSFDDRPNRFNAFDLKRTAEVWSPLNPRRIKYYDYRIVSEDEDGYLVIEFKTKDGVFPRKVRLYATGLLYLDAASYRIKKIVLRDHIDYWSSRMYVKNPEIPELLTSHVLTSSYINDEKYIYSEEVSLDISWKESQEYEKSTYFPVSARRRFPDKCLLHESQHLVFSDSRNLNKAERKDKRIYSSLGFESFYAPYVPDRWNADTVPWLDWNRLEQELFIAGLTLDDQANKTVPFRSFSELEDTERDLKSKQQLISLTQELQDKIYPTPARRR